MHWVLAQIDQELTDYYATRGKSSDSLSTKIGWKNEEAQTIRFEQLAKVISPKMKAFSINDLGCGFGDFSQYLVNHAFEHSVYNGYDLSGDALSQARKRYGDNARNHFFELSEPHDMRPADYTVASGIFNLKFNVPEYQWLYYILDTLTAINSKSRIGFSFNALTRYSDAEFMRDELYYADPCFLFDYCKRNISKDVALLHDYGQYDFTIITRKS